MNPRASTTRPPAGWKNPMPQRLPRKTYWPAMLALGVTIALLGPVTIWPVSLAGLALAAAALIGWIGELIR
jgi:hypothetical protein